ncbi:hypothetical protein Tco_0843913 [Tanacetum coccineum]
MQNRIVETSIGPNPWQHLMSLFLREQIQVVPIISNCPSKVLIISNPEPCYNQNVDEFPQTLPSFHPTCYSGDENSFTYDSNLNFVDDSPNPPPQPPTYSHEFCGNDAHYGHDCPPQVPFIYNPEPCYNQDFNFP